MTVTRIDLDPVGGIAGDMFAAAMLDALPDQAGAVQADLKAAGVPAGVTAEVEAAKTGGFRAARFRVSQVTNIKPPRTLPAMKTFFGDSELSAPVRVHVLSILRLLAEAEAHVHGESLSEVHFHEVSDWDSVVDIVAAASLIAPLRDAAWRVGPLPLGGGTVRTAHGDIPLPGPATLALLDGYEWIDDGVSGERVTPTGAAILKHLAPTPMVTPAAGRLKHTGIGCGTKDLEGRPNILRATLFGPSAETMDTDIVERLAFEIDDMTGEEIAIALDHLRALDGVLDASQVPMMGKKGRPAAGLRLIVSPATADAVIKGCFLETSTLGVRRETLRRHTLPRGTVPGAKQATRPDGTVTVKADSDGLAGTRGLAARRARAARIIGDD